MTGIVVYFEHNLFRSCINVTANNKTKIHVKTSPQLMAQGYQLMKFYSEKQNYGEKTIGFLVNLVLTRGIVRPTLANSIHVALRWFDEPPEDYQLRLRNRRLVFLKIIENYFASYCSAATWCLWCLPPSTAKLDALTTLTINFPLLFDKFEVEFINWNKHPCFSTILEK